MQRSTLFEERTDSWAMIITFLLIAMIAYAMNAYLGYNDLDYDTSRAVYEDHRISSTDRA